jgi:hypothetical protein
MVLLPKDKTHSYIKVVQLQLGETLIEGGWDNVRTVLAASSQYLCRE